MSDYTYELRKSLITETEKRYYQIICKLLPKGYVAYNQISLRAIIDKTDGSKYANELFRNIDIGIFESKTFRPAVLIEINDSTHNLPERIERDRKVTMICEEAGIPLIPIWLKDGLDETDIQNKIISAIECTPKRTAHPEMRNKNWVYHQEYIYELKSSLITQTEKQYYYAVCKVLPDGYFAQPQISLRSVADKTDNSRYASELFRNIDIGIFEKDTFRPAVLIEIKDANHTRPERIDRDKKVKMICEEMGIPLIPLWVKYGVNSDYIKQKINEAIEESQNPVRTPHPEMRERQGNFVYTPQKKTSDRDILLHIDKKAPYVPQSEKSEPKVSTQRPKSGNKPKKKKSGCYIATCVYGSYDCPEVRVLRRYRDIRLAKNIFGRLFIRVYYALSPKMVKYFGNQKWFRKFWKKHLDRIVSSLNKKGFENTPYKDYNE